MSVGGQLLDIGFTPEFLVMAAVLGLGAATIASFVIGGAAVAIVGPRRMDAVLLPAVVGFLVTMAGVLLVRDVALAWVAAGAFAAALLVAWLQKANIDDPTAPAASGVFVVGRALLGLLVGAGLGFVAMLSTGGPLALVLISLIGLAIGLRWGLSADDAAGPEPEARPPVVDPESPPRG